MKPVIIIAITFVLLIPITAHAEQLPDLGYDELSTFEAHPARDKLFACIEKDFSKKLVTARQFDDERGIMYSAISGLYHGVAEHLSQSTWTEYMKKLTQIHCPEMLSLFEVDKKINEEIIQVDSKKQLPDWIKNTAGWWADDSLTELEFMQSIQFLIEQKIMNIPQETITELKMDSKKRTFIIPTKDSFEILVSGQVPNYDPLKPLYVKVIKPDESTISLLSVPVGTTDGKFMQSFKLYPSSIEGEYKVVSSSDGNQYELETFLVKKQISSEVPTWIKNTAGWWAEGQIGDTEFISGIEFLIKNRIIQVGPEILGITPQIYTVDNYQAGCRTPENMNGSCFEKISEQSFDEIIKNESTKIDSLESLLPSNTDLKFLKENNDYWEIMEISNQGNYGELSSIVDSIRMDLMDLPKSELHDLEDYINSNTGLPEIDYGVIEIYKVTSPPELDEFWFSVFGETPYPTFSDSLTGKCYATIDGYAYTIGCSKGTLGLVSVGYSPTGLIQSEKISGFLMDRILEKINKINGKSYDISVLDVLDYETGIESESMKEVSTTSTEGFSGLYCTQTEYGSVKMTGQYTNGPDYYSTIYFTLGILDHNGRIVATGLGDVSNIGPYQTKIFDASASWDGDYKECIIEVDTAHP